MKDYHRVQEVLDAQHITLSDQEIVKNFLHFFSFEKRQQLMTIILGHPEKVALFVELIKRKNELQKNPTNELSAKILELENSEMERLIEELA